MAVDLEPTVTETVRIRIENQRTWQGITGGI
jgi:hypothetical protein